MLTKTDIPGMQIDPATGLVINTELGAYESIKRAREEKKRQFKLEEKLAKLEQRVADLESQLQEAREQGSIL